MAKGLDVGHWVGLVIGAMVLLIAVGALFTPFLVGASGYAANDTSGFGNIIVTLAPILLGVGILLVFVSAFLPKMHAGH